MYVYTTKDNDTCNLTELNNFLYFFDARFIFPLFFEMLWNNTSYLKTLS